MPHQCPACGSAAVAFAVPPEMRDVAPEEAARAAICTSCLRTAGVDATSAEADAATVANATDDAADFSAVHPAFPGGAGGVAFALLCGLLGSLALNRAAVQTLVERAEREGVDVFLTLDRLADDADGGGDLDPHFDVRRRRTQIEQFA